MKRLRLSFLIAALCYTAACDRYRTPPAPPAPPTAPAAPDTATTPATPTAPTTPTTPAAPGTPTAVSGEAIADLPDYPGAQRVEYKVGGPKPGFRKSVEVKLMTSEPYATVKAYYQKAIADGGWQIVATKDKVNDVSWTLRKGASMAEIDVETTRTGSVEIELERKDP